jgi:hypothetical protein
MPSPAILIAILALVAAVAGTAVAESGLNANTSASAKKTAKKALKKAKKANQTAKGAQASADDAQASADDATPLTAVVAADGSVARGTGVTSTNAKLGGSGLYTVEFDRSLSDCVWVAQIGNGNSTPTIYGEMSTWAESPNGIFVQTASSAGVLADRPFHLIVHC